MSDRDWSGGWETRPLVGRVVYSLPVCDLRVPGAEAPVRFTSSRVALGSSPDNDFVLQHETVSRFHAEVCRAGDDWLVRDLDSTNGTFVAGVRVREAFLAPGSVIRLGDAEVEFAPDSEEVRLAPSDRQRLGNLVGISAQMRRVFHLVEQVGPTDATVLIEGETGTGKEVLARTIHEHSRRASAPFVVIDCSAIPASLLESELFGHEKGSFSGALEGRKGLFEMTHRGTVFLDEVGELPLELQPKLLRVLESGEIRRVGSSRPLRLDVRIVAATNRNLAQEVEGGRFRRDLFFRLNVIPVRLPPLRERIEDVAPLAEHILASARFNDDGRGGRRVERLDRALLARLERHPFPGNVRELVNLLERLVSVGEEALEELSRPALAAPASGPRPGSGGLLAGEGGGVPDFKEAKERVVADFEESYLARLLEASGGNVSAAARISGLDRKHLRQLLRKYGLYYDDVP